MKVRDIPVTITIPLTEALDMLGRIQGGPFCDIERLLDNGIEQAMDMNVVEVR